MALLIGHCVANVEILKPPLPKYIYNSIFESLCLWIIDTMIKLKPFQKTEGLINTIGNQRWTSSWAVATELINFHWNLFLKDQGANTWPNTHFVWASPSLRNTLFPMFMGDVLCFLQLLYQRSKNTLNSHLWVCDKIHQKIVCLFAPNNTSTVHFDPKLQYQ